MDAIPSHLLLEIFRRLPLEDIGRSRRVCRQWCNLLYAEDFLRSLPLVPRGFVYRQSPYQGQPPPPQEVAAGHPDAPLREVRYISLTTQRSFAIRTWTASRIVACHNGLLLTTVEGKQWALTNPLTGMEIQLPQPDGLTYADGSGSGAIDYEPRTSASDFRIFLFTVHPSEHGFYPLDYTVEVFRSGSRRWETLPLRGEENRIGSLYFPSGRPMYAGGILCAFEMTCLVVIDVETGHVWRFPVGDESSSSRGDSLRHSLADSGGSVYVSSSDWLDLYVWEMVRTAGRPQVLRAMHISYNAPFIKLLDIMPFVFHVQDGCLYIRVGQRKVAVFDTTTSTHSGGFWIEGLDEGCEDDGGRPLPLFAYSPTPIGGVNPLDRPRRGH